MKKIVWLICFCTALLLAIPSDQKPREITLDNGEKITLVIIGDERINISRTSDGYSVLFNEKKKIYEYLVMAKDSSLVSSGVKAKDPAKRTKKEKKFLIKVPKELWFSAAQTQKKLDSWK